MSHYYRENFVTSMTIVTSMTPLGCATFLIFAP